MTITLTDYSFLACMQLASPALPVGAYSYSEGLETLVEDGAIVLPQTLRQWLEDSLRYGAIRLEAAVMLRAYRSAKIGDIAELSRWNLWLSASRETEELRNSSWQMGRSLIQLLKKLQPQIAHVADGVGNPCNYAVAFGIAAAHWEIGINFALLAYLHSWASNIITAGIKLIPLGQTVGQQLLLELQTLLSHTANEILNLEDDDLNCCTWGLSLASMRHEILYTRLFRS